MFYGASYSFIFVMHEEICVGSSSASFNWFYFNVLTQQFVVSELQLCVWPQGGARESKVSIKSLLGGGDPTERTI